MYLLDERDSDDQNAIKSGSEKNEGENNAIEKLVKSGSEKSAEEPDDFVDRAVKEKEAKVNEDKKQI